MILDNLTALIGSVSSQNAIVGQQVTSLGTTRDNNVIDLASLALGGNQAPGAVRNGAVNLSLSVLQTLTSAGAATVRVALITADDAALTTNVQVVDQTDDIAYTQLIAGKTVQLTCGAAGLVNRRYLGAQITIGTAPLTNASAQFFGALTVDTQSTQTIYRGNFAVL